MEESGGLPRERLAGNKILVDEVADGNLLLSPELLEQLVGDEVSLPGICRTSGLDVKMQSGKPECLKHRLCSRHAVLSQLMVEFSRLR